MNPSYQLAGMTITGEMMGEWKVIEMVGRIQTDTGGGQSASYWVERSDGQLGFLKAIDFTRAHSSPSPPDMLKFLIDAYIFERDLCLRCKNKSLKRVVHAIDHGTVTVDESHPFKDFMKVSFLIFDRAEADIRRHLNVTSGLDDAFSLRTLHNIAAALGQLHRANLAHQDLKPSNVLVFNEERARISKLADLGRAWSKDTPGPFDMSPVPGDPGYAPPELLYGYVPPDERTRRYGCDLYLLGSMIVFMFSRVHMNALIEKHIGSKHRFRFWVGGYRSVLPYVQSAFGLALTDFGGDVPLYLREDLVEMVAKLCEPDPSKRGLSFKAGVNRDQFSLEWFISRLDNLTRRAQSHFKQRPDKRLETNEEAFMP